MLYICVFVCVCYTRVLVCLFGTVDCSMLIVVYCIVNIMVVEKAAKYVAVLMRLEILL